MRFVSRKRRSRWTTTPSDKTRKRKDSPKSIHLVSTKSAISWQWNLWVQAWATYFNSVGGDSALKPRLCLLTSLSKDLSRCTIGTSSTETSSLTTFWWVLGTIRKYVTSLTWVLPNTLLTLRRRNISTTSQESLWLAPPDMFQLTLIMERSSPVEMTSRPSGMF